MERPLGSDTVGGRRHTPSINFVRIRMKRAFCSFLFQWGWGEGGGIQREEGGGVGGGISSAFWSLDRSGADVKRQAKVPETLQKIGTEQTNFFFGSHIPQFYFISCPARPPPTDEALLTQRMLGE